MFAPISQKIELFSKDLIHSMVYGSFEKIELTLVAVILFGQKKWAYRKGVKRKALVSVHQQCNLFNREERVLRD